MQLVSERFVRFSIGAESKGTAWKSLLVIKELSETLDFYAAALHAKLSEYEGFDHQTGKVQV